jgi:hypothetical protein
MNFIVKRMARKGPDKSSCVKKSKSPKGGPAGYVSKIGDFSPTESSRLNALTESCGCVGDGVTIYTARRPARTPVA